MNHPLEGSPSQTPPQHETIEVDLDAEGNVMNLPGVKAIESIPTAPPAGTTVTSEGATAEGSGGVRERSDLANGWTQQIEIYVSSISMKCKDYRNIHEASTIYYDKRNSYFTIFLIFVSFMVSAISLIPFFNGEAFKYVIALLSVFTTTLATVNKFLKYQESSTKHRLASQKFLEIHRNITEQFLLPERDRTNGKQYLSYVGRAFDQIIKTAPYPPEAVKTRYKMTSTPDSDVRLPANFDSSAVVAKPNPNPSQLPTTEPSTVPSVNVAVPATTSDPIHAVNPESSSPESSKQGLSEFAKYQLRRARNDMDMFSGDYD
jgi:hypothetical protein